MTVNRTASRHTRLFFAASALAALALATVTTPAHAQMSLVITPTTLAGLPGATLIYQATLSNLGTGEVFLNADTFNLSGANLSLDDSPFFENFPLSMLGGETFTGNLFTVNIGAANPGLYNGTFTILGGPTDTANNPLATGNFGVQVNASAPEPTSGFLILGAVLPVAALWNRRRKMSANKA